MKEINVTFVTGNIKKKEYLEKLLNLKIKNQKVDLDEIQSLDVKEVVKHKVVQAYSILKVPVLVEDTSLEFEELGGLPGPFIRFFVDNVPLEKVCKMIGENRKAVARCVFGYFDGEKLELIEGSQNGKISEIPKGEKVYGWDKIFIPEGYNITRAEMNEEDDIKTYLRTKPIEKVKIFLEKNL
jgi:non-canonical purine NTP pyrophosphatase (RdgB/HAM1 family)